MAVSAKENAAHEVKRRDTRAFTPTTLAGNFLAALEDQSSSSLLYPTTNRQDVFRRVGLRFGQQRLRNGDLYTVKKCNKWEKCKKKKMFDTSSCLTSSFFCVFTTY